jgi:hypothetical protein
MNNLRSNFLFVPRKDQPKFKPKFIEIIIREIIKSALRLKKIHPKKYMLLTIKDYYKNNFPEEFRLHEKFQDWSTRCNLTRQKILVWLKKAVKDAECMEFKKEVEIRKKTPVKNIKIDRKDIFQKHCFMFRVIHLEKTSKTPISDATKEFVRERYPEEYAKYEKFKDWRRCPIKRSTVFSMVRRLKKYRMLTPTMRRKVKLSCLQKEDRGTFLFKIFI